MYLVPSFARHLAVYAASVIVLAACSDTTRETAGESESDESGLITAQTPPRSPTALEGRGSATVIHLSWTDHSVIESGFRIFRSRSADGPFRMIGLTEAANQTTFDDTNVDRGATYYYYVDAYRDSETQIFSAHQSNVVAVTAEGSELERPTGERCTPQAVRNWDFAWQDGPDGAVNDYVACLGDSLSDELYGGGGSRVGAMFLANEYPHHAEGDRDEENRVWRHMGFDAGRAVDTPVHALASGRVVRNWDDRSDLRNSAIVIQEPGAGRYWVYGHLDPAVREGAFVSRGEVIGRVGNPRGDFSPHCHLTVLREFPFYDVDPDMGWGIAKSRRNGADAEQKARRWSMHPILAYAMARGLPH